jgi:hypothetical protein
MDLGYPLGLGYLRVRMAVLPMGKGTRGYPTTGYGYRILLAGKGKGMKLYPWATVRVRNSICGLPKGTLTNETHKNI